MTKSMGLAHQGSSPNLSLPNLAGCANYLKAHDGAGENKIFNFKDITGASNTKPEQNGPAMLGMPAYSPRLNIGELAAPLSGMSQQTLAALQSQLAQNNAAIATKR